MTMPKDCSAAKFRDESHDSSSRAARRLPALERHSGAIDLWPIGGSSPLLEQLELDGEILLRVLPEVVNQFNAFGRELVDI